MLIFTVSVSISFEPKKNGSPLTTVFMYEREKGDERGGEQTE